MARRHGFTLIELSIVLVVLSLMISGIMSAMQQDMRRNRKMETQRKLNTIEAELKYFIRLNGRLPCPADGSKAITDQSFGIEAGTVSGGVWTADAGNCTNALDTTKANFSDGSNTVGGVVPIKTLGLSDEYAFDSWGGRFFYAVDKRMTAGGAFTTYSASSTSVGSISVMDNSGANYRVQASGGNGGAVAVIISFGPDGHGAYQLSGSVKYAGSTNTNELKNCHCTASAAGAFDATFIQAAPTTITSASDPLDVFDDIVRYYTRLSLYTPADSGR